MRIYFKRRIFRVYLRIRARANALATGAFVCIARLSTGINVSPADVRAGTYQRGPRSPALQIKGEKVTDETVSIAKDRFEESRTRISTVAAKVGTLLTVTSIAVSGTLTSLSLIGFPSNPFFYCAFLLTILVFLCTGWFLFKFLGVGRSATPDLDQVFLELGPAEKKAAYIQTLISAAEQNDARNDFLVDVYKAGRRMSVLSFGCALILLALAVSDRIGREDRLILKLRSDPQLVELLRGPKGASGAEGPAGKPGAKGDAGDRGPVYFPPLAPHMFEQNPFPLHLQLGLSKADGASENTDVKTKPNDQPR